MVLPFTAVVPVPVLREVAVTVPEKVWVPEPLRLMAPSALVAPTLPVKVWVPVPVLVVKARAVASKLFRVEAKERFESVVVNVVSAFKVTAPL